MPDFSGVTAHRRLSRVRFPEVRTGFRNVAKQHETTPPRIRAPPRRTGSGWRQPTPTTIDRACGAGPRRHRPTWRPT